MITNHKTVSANQRDMMLHALGNKPTNHTRNYYCVPVDTPDEHEWRALVEEGLAKPGAVINDGRDRYYCVSHDGLVLLREPQTDAPPPPPQETEAGLCEMLPELLQPEIGLVDLIKRKLAQEQARKGFGSPSDEMMLAYMYCAANAESYEQRRLAAERELAALRTRLETAEGALLSKDDIKRIVRLERLGQILRERSDLKMDRHMLIEPILAVYADTKILREKLVPIAEAALNPPAPALGGGGGGEATEEGGEGS